MITKDNELSHEAVARTLEVGPGGGWGRRLKRLLTWLILAGFLTAIGWYFLARQTKAEESVQYTTQPLQAGDLSQKVTATGNLEPIKQVDVGSELSGTVETVEVERDQYVTAGQVLARVNTSKLEAQEVQLESGLQAAQAKLLQAEATLAESQSQLARLERVKELSGGKVPSEQELESGQAAVKRAEADKASAEASVAQAQAALEATRTDLSKAVIRSPINGVVLKRSIEPGQTVAASFQSPVLFTIAQDLRRMELHVDIDEADISQIKVGQQASFTVDAYPDRQFTARITQVSFGSETVDGVVTYEGILEVKNPQLLLRPGMTATADITTKTVKDALLVPNAALRFSPEDESQQSAGENRSLVGQLVPRIPGNRSQRRQATQPAGKEQHVYVLRQGQPVRIPVMVGSTDGKMTQVVSGDLKPGTEVILDQSTGRNG